MIKSSNLDDLKALIDVYTRNKKDSVKMTTSKTRARVKP
jgi:hypothetical protein